MSLYGVMMIMMMMFLLLLLGIRSCANRMGGLQLVGAVVAVLLLIKTGILEDRKQITNAVVNWDLGIYISVCI